MESVLFFFWSNKSKSGLRDFIQNREKALTSEICKVLKSNRKKVFLFFKVKRGKQR